ncbi:hypothetical protein BSNK01_25610 [Bacillaceae bacterium]
MSQEPAVGKNVCENCGSDRLTITTYEDPQSSQTVFHCHACGYIHWKDSVTHRYLSNS